MKTLHPQKKAEGNKELCRSHDLTIEEVRSCPMFAHFADEQAKEVIETIKRLSEIAIAQYYRNKQRKVPG